MDEKVDYKHTVNAHSQGMNSTRWSVHGHALAYHYVTSSVFFLSHPWQFLPINQLDSYLNGGE